MEYCSQWLQFLDGYVCRPLHLTLEVAKYLALELRIDIVECAEVIEASPIHSLTVDAFGEGLEELLSILCAIGSMLLKLPAELAVAQQAVEYMRGQSGVTVEEVTGI